MAEEPEWKRIARAKFEERQSKLPKEWIVPPELLPPPEQTNVQDFPETSGFFTPRELEITNATASEVVKKISEGAYSAVEVVRSACKRATVAQQLVNCLTEIAFDSAIARAEELDAYFKLNRKTVGPLHGLPISFKDMFNLEGLDTTIGYVSYANRPATENSTVVSLLIQAGAIPYVKTNIPATLFMGETINNIFGRTVNPHNRLLSPLGSSGGEAALVAFKGSSIGVGTDIFGSIRMPCAVTGLYGLRPTHGRVPYQGVTDSLVGQESIRSTAGPISRSPSDIRLFMSSLLAQKPWITDSQCVPIPWRTEEEILPDKLCFRTWLFMDKDADPSPPIQRAMRMVTDSLKKAGHTVIPLEDTDGWMEAETLDQMASATGWERIHQDISSSGEPWCGGYSEADWVQPTLTVSELWQLHHQRDALATKWCKKWNETVNVTGTGRPIDALIHPITHLPARRHFKDQVGGGLPWVDGTFMTLPSVLGLTSGAFPVTIVDLELDKLPVGSVAKSPKHQTILDEYGSPKNHENSPVGLAITGRRFEEEKITALLGLLERVLSV